MSVPTVRRPAALLVALTLLAAFAAPVAAADGAAYVALANAQRATVNLPPVALSAAVEQITAERAAQMAHGDNFTHNLPYVAQRLGQLGVCATTYGETIAWESGYATYDPARTMGQWWRSSGHHAIIVGDYNAAAGSHATSAASGKLYSVMVFVKLCPGAGGGGVAVERLSGSDRYATATAISRARFVSGAGTVFIATGANFPDALAGSPAAAKANGPILLTTRDALPATTATELARLQPSTIVILGGTGSVSDAVAGQLRAYAATVQRWSGTNRFETAAAISRATFVPGVPVAYVATGTTFPDALSGGAIAGRNGGPILLVDGGLPATTAAELARLRPARIVVLGGPSVVSDAVAGALAGYATSGSVTRLAGADRYATSVAISQAGYGGAGSDAAFITTGSNFPDGLAGGPVAALLPGPLLLVGTTTLPASVAGELRRLDPDRVYVLGGAGTVSEGVVGSIRATLP